MTSTVPLSPSILKMSPFNPLSSNNSLISSAVISLSDFTSPAASPPLSLGYNSIKALNNVIH